MTIPNLLQLNSGRTFIKDHQLDAHEGREKNISLSEPNPMAIDDWRHQSDMTKVFLRQLINL